MIYFDQHRSKWVYASSTAVTSGSAASNNISFTNLTANTLSVKSDSFSGFTVSAILTMNNKNSTETSSSISTAGGNLNVNGWGIGADYNTLNKFYASATYDFEILKT